MRRNLVKTGQCSDEKAALLVATLRRAFPKSIVSGYEQFLPVMRNHSDDRHVAAAAMAAQAQVVVTNNLKHFRWWASRYPSPSAARLRARPP